MSFNLSCILITATFLALILLFRTGRKYPTTPYGFKGKLVFQDEGKKKGFAFVSERFQAGATPDMIYQTGRNKFTIMELKSRNGPVYESDVIQALMGVLATHKRYNVTKIVIKTNSETESYNVKSPRKVYKDLKPLIQQEIKLQKGKVLLQRKKHKPKCISCRHYSKCNPTF